MSPPPPGPGLGCSNLRSTGTCRRLFVSLDTAAMASSSALSSPPANALRASAYLCLYEANKLFCTVLDGQVMLRLVKSFDKGRGRW